MRRFVYAAPAALISAACASRPWTPSVSVAYWAQDVPASVDTSLPTTSQLLPLWQLPTGNPWSRYAKATLLTALGEEPRTGALPDVEALEVLGDARAAAHAVASAGLPQGTLWMLDLRGAASVAFATTLSHEAREPVSLVLTFNNWPDPDELVPAEETLAALIRMPPKAPDPAATGTYPIFLLDSWRLAYRFDAPPDNVFDNRYVMSPGDLPTPEVLRENGVTRLVYVVEDLDDTETEEDDLHFVFAAYQQAGIALHLVDLRMLAKRKPGARWPSELAAYTLFVGRRATLLEDPKFYERARGGFGAFGPPRIFTRGPMWGGGGGSWRGGGGG
ncbi:hypothetical protein [Pendulispora albinea]|uniref:Uncharacterized protein n=1 Tax=Pendulispora albinea TaxID=2741071 RepID=A0ABZ2LW41_9BACT